MAEVIIYTTLFCPYCSNAKALLKNKGVAYTEIRIDNDPEKFNEMLEKSGQKTVPQIFINGRSIGGFSDLYKLQQQGELDTLLAS